jgi:hypothetical protein
VSFGNYWLIQSQVKSLFRWVSAIRRASSPLDQRICVRPLITQQIGQPDNAGSNVPRLVLGYEIGCSPPPCFLLKIDVRHRKAVRVLNDETGVVGFLDRSRRREAAACHHRRVNNRAASRITSAPGITSPNTNPKNGETLIIIGP